MSIENQDDLLKELYNSGAILRGHFLLSSGLHSDVYIQCALLLQSPQRATQFASALIRLIPAEMKNTIDLVVAPALGGLIIGYEVARLLGKDFVFFERVNKNLELRRGFEIKKGQNILLVEDVVTTAGSSINVLQKVKQFGGKVGLALSIIDRSATIAVEKFASFGCQFSSIVQLECKVFDSSNIPVELQGIPCIKPGSNNS